MKSQRELNQKNIDEAFKNLHYQLKTNEKIKITINNNFRYNKMKIYEKEINQAVKEIKEQFKDPLIITEWTSYQFDMILDIITDNLPQDLKKSLGAVNDGIIEKERRAFDTVIFSKLSDHVNINL